MDLHEFWQRRVANALSLSGMTTSLDDVEDGDGLGMSRQALSLGDNGKQTADRTYCIRTAGDWSLSSQGVRRHEEAPARGRPDTVGHQHVRVHFTATAGSDFAQFVAGLGLSWLSARNMSGWRMVTANGYGTRTIVQFASVGPCVQTQRVQVFDGGVLTSTTYTPPL